MNAQTRTLVKGLVLIATLVAVGLALRLLELDQALDEHWIDAHIRGQGALGWLTFLAVAALFTAAGLPRQIIAFLAGYAYGFIAGTAIATLGTALGAAITFSYARFLGRSLVKRRLGTRISKIDAFLHENPFSMTLIIRLMPVGSNILTNLVAGVSSVRSAPYLLGSALGFIPQTAIFALLGSGFKVDFAWRVATSAILFLLSTWLGWRLYRTKRRAAAAIEE